MLNLPVGAVQITKGVEYVGMFHRANAFYLPKDVQVSISRSPLVPLVNEVLRLDPAQTYMFSKTFPLPLYLDIDLRHQIFESVETKTDIDIPKDVTTTPVGVEVMFISIDNGKHDEAVNGTTLNIVIYIENTSGTEIYVDCEIKDNNTLVGTGGVKVLPNSISPLVVRENSVVMTSTPGLHITVFAKEVGCTVIGSKIHSIAQMIGTINTKLPTPTTP